MKDYTYEIPGYLGKINPMNISEIWFKPGHWHNMIGPDCYDTQIYFPKLENFIRCIFRRPLLKPKRVRGEWNYYQKPTLYIRYGGAEYAKQFTFRTSKEAECHYNAIVSLLNTMLNDRACKWNKRSDY